MPWKKGPGYRVQGPGKGEHVYAPISLRNFGIPISGSRASRRDGNRQSIEALDAFRANIACLSPGRRAIFTRGPRLK
jgi:hypothetical protein